MKIKMLNNLIGVEKKAKASKKSEGFLAMTESVDSSGIIKFIGDKYDGDLKVGDSVYYGNKRERIRIGNNDVEVMEASNIVAILEESDGESEQA
jgi:co-chaperonin GroES (HSP10)